MSKVHTTRPIPLDDLHLHFGHGDKAREHSRSLNLQTGIYRSEYKIGGVSSTREILASYPDGVIALRLEATETRMLTFKATLSISSATL
ncbi:glycoside hydrolase N-terminal domain-containing protein [Paenibacillus sp. 19GGS1-52]|nr:glycoside hydrolase N-terminal domain-containing protein [Paenibacillus sp. 19GGS1-52]